MLLNICLLVIVAHVYLCSTKWIKTHGGEYHRGDYIVTGKQENDLPVFSDNQFNADC